jgi:hypothetical protein
MGFARDAGASPRKQGFILRRTYDPELKTAGDAEAMNEPVAYKGEVDFTHPDFAMFFARRDLT